ncbi:hypothetical protein BGZ94_000578 [Podila epigama]|nr:hypothetical protein BGZ94_000578 [Podila epigama]
MLAFRLLLDTLRHEQDQPTPVLRLSSTLNRERCIRRTSTMYEQPVSTTTSSVPQQQQRLHHQQSFCSLPSRSLSILPTPLRPYRPPKEYGIPFHGKRSYHRAQFIRELDFQSLASSLSLHHFEILARSNRIGFRSLNLHGVPLPFSEHLLSILVSSKQLRKLTLGAVEFPPAEDLACLRPCLAGLTELYLMELPDSVGDTELTFLLRHSPTLQVLEIHGESFTDRSLGFIASTCLELESLTLQTPLVTNEVIIQIAKCCPKLSTWRLIDCTEVTETAAEMLSRTYDWDMTSRGMHHRFGGIATGVLTGETGTGEAGQPMYCSASLASLTAATEALSLSASHLPPSPPLLASSASSASSATSASSSTSLSTSWPTDSNHSFYHKGSKDAGERSYDNMISFSHQSSQQQQQQLHLQRQLSWQPTFGVSTLDLRNCTSINPCTVNSILRAQQSQLQHLSLGGFKITDDALICLTEVGCPRLRTLELYDCAEVSDETMVATLFNCDGITKMRIRGSNFTFRTFAAIALHLSGSLEELHLEHVRLIINETMQDIMLRCKRLRVLKLWHCRNLTQDLFTEQMDPCTELEVLEYMDKYARPYQNQAVAQQLANHQQQPWDRGLGGNSGMGAAWERQVRFLQTLVIRFENLRILRLGKLADNHVPINLVSYLCQLDRLERFSIFQNSSLDMIDLKELQMRLPTIIELGVGVSEKLTEQDVLRFNSANRRPNVLLYRRMLESSDELATYVYQSSASQL